MLGAEEVLEVLGRLVDKSLVVAETGGGGAASGQGARYRLLEPVRQYARERLEHSGEADLVWARHAAYYLALAEHAEPRLYGPALPVWRARLEQEHPNLRAALDWCLRHDPATGLALAGCLAPFWHMHGHDTEGRRWLDGLLAAAAAPDATAQRQPLAGTAGERRGKALLGAGVLALRQRDFAAARTALAQSLAVYRQASDAAGIGWAEHFLGLALVEAGDYGPARQLVEASRARFEALDDQRGIATALASLGDLARRQGDLGRAGTVAAECLALFRAIGGAWDLTRPLLTLALIAVAQADYGRATALYEETLALYRELRDEEGVREVLGWLGNLVRIQGDYRRARELLGESLALARKSGVNTRVGLSLHKLGHVAAAEGHAAEAWGLYEESLALYRADGDLQLAGVVLGDMGNLARVQGDYGRAGALWAESAALARSRLGHTWLMAWTLGNVGTLLVCRDDVARGVRLLSAAAAIHPQVRLSIDPDERADWDAALAQGGAALGRSTFAAEWAAGQAMTAEQALTDAEAAAASGPPARPVPSAAALTAQEREVAALVAAGCHADREIAARLTTRRAAPPCATPP